MSLLGASFNVEGLSSTHDPLPPGELQGHLFCTAFGACQPEFGPASVLHDHCTLSIIFYCFRGHINDSGGRFPSYNLGSPLEPGIEYLWMVS